MAGDTEVVTIPADSALLKRIKVETVVCVKLPLDEVVAPGKIETNPNRISKIAMPVPGRIKRVLVGIGDSVEQNQPIFTIDSPEISSATSSYRQAIARVGQTKVALTKAEADLSRLQELFANRAVAQKEVLNAQAVLGQAKSDVEQGQAQLEEGQRRFTILGLTAGVPNQEVVVRAPLSGKILERNLVTILVKQRKRWSFIIDFHDV